MTAELSVGERLHALYRVGKFQPKLTAGILTLSLFAAVLEGIGLSFLYPIIQLSQSSGQAGSENGALEAFVTVYEFVGLPFTLETVVVGVALIMTARYTSSFLVTWMKVHLKEHYVEYLQTESFVTALDADITYFDKEGSDDILNAIVTQANYAGQVIQHVVRLIEQSLISLAYLGIAVYIAPSLTLASGLLLGTTAVLLRYLLESGYTVGDRVATANERVQEAVQAGMQGIRDVKLFNMRSELRQDFIAAIDQAVTSKILLNRNKAALNNIYQLATAITVFLLIYVALRVFSLSLGSLGVFLFAMFRLAPRAGTLNNLIYNVEGNLPHLVRTQEFISELESHREPQVGTKPVPAAIADIVFDDVGFVYDTGERIFDDLSFSISKGEFAAFVGPSGAGKSTIVSLLTRMYEPDEGEIRADGTPIDEFDLAEWRSSVSVVRQQPFIFNDTLRRNITIGNRGATDDEIERVCDIAEVTQFLGELPDGYDTVLGDNGVRLSGGQKQRVAVARALLKDAELLILDEATSDLDSNIEERVHRAIESMDREYATLVIAHRLSTVINADCIYAIEDGRITEAGSHSDLVERGGTYADLYTTQTRGK